MCQLVTRSSILHVCSTLNIIRGFVDNKAVSSHDCPDIVFFFLTSDTENLVLNLDWAEIFGQDFWVVKFDSGGSLWVKLMDQKLIVIIIVIMQARFVLLQDKVWFKWNNIMEETSELIQLWANLDLWSRVFLKVLFMFSDLLRKRGSFCRQCIKSLTFLQYLKELTLTSHLALFADLCLDALDKVLHRIKCLFCKVFARRGVLLYTF